MVFEIVFVLLFLFIFAAFDSLGSLATWLLSHTIIVVLFLSIVFIGINVGYRDEKGQVDISRVMSVPLDMLRSYGELYILANVIILAVSDGAFGIIELCSAVVVFMLVWVFALLPMMLIESYPLIAEGVSIAIFWIGFFGLCVLLWFI